jgi:hypothetical protein
MGRGWMRTRTVALKSAELPLSRLAPLRAAEKALEGFLKEYHILFYFCHWYIPQSSDSIILVQYMMWPQLINTLANHFVSKKKKNIFPQWTYFKDTNKINCQVNKYLSSYSCLQVQLPKIFNLFFSPKHLPGSLFPTLDYFLMQIWIRQVFEFSHHSTYNQNMWK